MENFIFYYLGISVGFGLGMLTAIMPTLRRLRKDLAALEERLNA